MIRLHPTLDASQHLCPHCEVQLEVIGWCMPGMRSLAELHCKRCGREYFGDLPVAHGIRSPKLLEKRSGVIHENTTRWFGKWLSQSYSHKRNEPIEFIVEEKKAVRRAIILNCLDKIYGHILLKLLNAQYYLEHRPDLDLIVLIPRALRWLVPDGVAAIWTVDVPLNRGYEWNDWLAQEIHSRVEMLDECFLSVAFPHPHPRDFDIENFSRVKPFPMDDWELLLSKPTITFIWREDRLWTSFHASRLARVKGYINRLGTRLPARPLLAVHKQSLAVVTLAEQLRNLYPNLDFAVAGLGDPGGLPPWIVDMRVRQPDEFMERVLCERYAQSHIVIGVHGSNMLLPSAHSGAVIELMPHKRWGNLSQDLLLRLDDQRETLYRYRVLPISMSVNNLHNVVTSVLSDRMAFMLNMKYEWCRHQPLTEIGSSVDSPVGS